MAGAGMYFCAQRIYLRYTMGAEPRWVGWGATWWVWRSEYRDLLCFVALDHSTVGHRIVSILMSSRQIICLDLFVLLRVRHCVMRLMLSSGDGTGRCGSRVKLCICLWVLLVLRNSPHTTIQKRVSFIEDVESIMTEHHVRINTVMGKVGFAWLKPCNIHYTQYN